MRNTRSLFVPLIAIVIGTFMVILDTTVVNVALPTLGHAFGADLSLLQWVISAYLLAQAAVIPLAGWLSDRFGARRVYLVSLVLFTLGSVLCGLALSAEMLIATRILQGLGGGMLMPIGMAVLFRLTPPERRGAVFGLLGLPIMVAPAIGPLLSGYLVQYVDWRLIFLINVPIGIVALVIGRRVLPVLPPGRAAGALDTLGIVLGPVGFAALSFGISQSTFAGWTAPLTLIGISIGLTALALFVWRELSVADPVLDLRVFRSRDFTLAIATQWAGFGAIFGTFLLVPLFLQEVQGYGAFATGLFTLPQAIAAGIFMQVGGRVFDRVGARLPVVAGLTLVAVAMWQLSGIGSATTGDDLRLPLFLLGAGMGMMMAALNPHILGAAPQELVGRVTSLTQALQNLVASLAIATFATILQARLPVHLGEGSAAGAFGDVYRIALIVVLLAWCLAWGLRRPSPVAKTGAAEPHAAEREAVLAGG